MELLLVIRKKNKQIENNKQSKDEEYCEQCNEDLPKDHICYTCCGDEITDIVKDVGLCPTCLEHI